MTGQLIADEQGTGRRYVDSIVDERTLREICLRPFEIAVRTAQPRTCAHNRLYGEFCAEHRTLLTGILRDEWRHEGIVMSDWLAANDRPAGIAAGLDLQMPGGHTNRQELSAHMSFSVDSGPHLRNAENGARPFFTSNGLEDESTSRRLGFDEPKPGVQVTAVTSPGSAIRTAIAAALECRKRRSRWPSASSSSRAAALRGENGVMSSTAWARAMDAFHDPAT